MNEILLAEVTGKSKEYVIAHPELKLTPVQKKKYLKMRQQLDNGWPLAYVLGYKWFYGIKIAVSPSVLIPRPETEQLVDMALDIAKKKRVKAVADIGTGSGAIITAIAKNYKSKLYAVDISAKALAIAKKNAKGLKIKFFKGSLLNPLLKTFAKKTDPILILANLPYLNEKQLSEPSIKKEPKLALYGGPRGIKKIEQLLKQTSKLHCPLTVILEMNYDQGKMVHTLTKKHLPEADVKIHKDIFNRDRFAVISKP